MYDQAPHCHVARAGAAAAAVSHRESSAFRARPASEHALDRAPEPIP